MISSSKHKLIVQKTLLVLFITLFIFHPVYVAAQDCDGLLSNSNRFDINDNGTITDIVSGLTWQRCALGQSWNGQTCTGNALVLTWHEANHQTRLINTKSNSEENWRLPKVPELASIVDISCKSPRIDLALFPKTSASPYWTLNSVPDRQGHAYTLSFGTKGIQRSLKSDKHYVRLVSGRD